MAENIRIGIRGDADFSQAEASARQSADRIARTLQGAPVINPFRPQDAEDFHSAITKIERALKATGQAGKAFSDIQFPLGQFADAEKHLDRIKDRIEQMRRDSTFGRSIIKRAGEFGLDTERPHEWTPEQFRRMYRDPRIADMNWQRFMGPGYQAGAPPQSGPGHREGGAAQGLAYGAQVLGRQAIGQAGMGGSFGLGMGARGAAMAAGGSALAATGVGAVVAGVGAAGMVLMKGYEEHKKTLESVDAQYKAIGSKDGFGGLMDRTRELGNALQMSQSEAGQLAQQFIKLSNEADSEQALQHAGYAGRFARTFGMQPGEGATAFGRAQRAGIGETDAEMQKFAVMLSQTIQGSGMDAQAGQVMEQMVGYLANIEQSLGREATMTEAQGYSDMLRALYGPDGAMSSGAASGILGGLSGFGSGKSPIDEALSHMAYGDALGWDFGKIKYFQEQPMSATPNSVFGEGGDKTRFEMIMAEAKKRYSTMLSEDPRLGFGAAYEMMGHGSTTEGVHAYDMHQRLKQGLPPAEGGRDLRETIADEKRSNDARIANASADMAARLMPTIETFKTKMAEMLEGVEGFVTGTEKAIDSLGVFSGALDAAAMIANPVNAASVAGRAAGVVGDAIVAPAGASANPLMSGARRRQSRGGSANPTPHAINPGLQGNAPRSWRNNNPGNIEGQYFGAVGNDGRFAIYDSPEDGWRAMEKQILRYFDGKTTGTKLRTVRDIIGTWSPAADPTNAPGTTPAYMQRVAKELGVDVDEVLDLRGDPEMMRKLLSAMATHEAGRATPYGSTFGATPPPISDFMQQFGTDAGNWLSTGAMLPGMADLPREIQQQQKEQQERAEARQQALSAAADLNVNINQTAANGQMTTKQYNLSVGEPRVSGSPPSRQVWNHEALS